VIDSRLANEGNGWAGSGAHPWHLDNETESILFLTNMSDKEARIGFRIKATSVDYYLTKLKLNPHETRGIDMRQLRDAQQPDFKKNKIPVGATDGSVNWIRLDDVPVMGRLVVIQRHKGMASNYDCDTCPCPANFNSISNTPDPINLTTPGTTMDCTCTAMYQSCNGIQTYFNETSNSTWSSDDTAVAYMDSSVKGRVHGLTAGTANITASFTGIIYNPPSPTHPYCFSSSSTRTYTSACNVGAHPVNFTLSASGSPAAGVLEFCYTWQSSTGNYQDLAHCVVYEVVNYPATSTTYVWPSPPWSYSTSNPTVNGVPGTDLRLTDDMLTGTFLKPYTAGSVLSTQYYRYTCDGGSEVNLQGPIANSRSVAKNTNGSYAYTVTSRGTSASINPLP
jgi:hypothetical protein